MMKVVAAALVLVVGAAVVLWFGNTLNSWVLGGLIGGLAAILLSIPISLVLFSYLSRRRDEQLRADLREDEYPEVYEYEDAPVRVVHRTYAAEGYALQAGPEEVWSEEDEYYQQRALARQAQRSLPPPRPQRVAEQSQTMNRLPAARQNGRTALPKPAQKNASRGKNASGRRATRHNNAGSPGYRVGSMQRSQKSAAIHAARLEQARQANEMQHDDVEFMPTYISRRVPTVRPDRDANGQYGRRPRMTHQLSQRDPQEPLPLKRRTPSTDVPLNQLSPSSLDDDEAYLHEEPHTDNLSADYYPDTGSFRRSTDQFARHPHLDERPSGSINKPLQRRAPYMYDDDALREELWQQMPPPRVRRSTRHLEQQHFDEED